MRSMRGSSDASVEIQKLANGEVTMEKKNCLNFLKIISLALCLQSWIVCRKNQNLGEVEKALSIFFSNYKKKHSHRECPLNIKEVCGVFQ